ncbi:hypothetical protein K437DRAFT_262515 [Tilletiaria anomala UBC 951]|uniref:Ricin B lectin domain-containing protein n=1 Tax=Tilletiaria anomala (strain ATCC 24038 / CBS 436.72 / UBC 951) TaxID=1037660 RepID=A0A066W8Q1_TILAU|nr:uncharacterized protein K437DRAFT_262515 [Tilletiaria anomala UBC 951]KDN47165.1 hypothetical protein K437DRAFT_262515 [Tilletiaria anomala UBC 951]
MHFALTAAISALLVASASVAVPTKRDQVKTYSTKYEAPLVLRSTQSDYKSHYASFNGDRDGSGHQILVTMHNGKPAPAETFKFLSVTSNVIGSSGFPSGCYGLGDSGGSECYGILQSTKNTNYCIAANVLKQSNARFIAVPCSYADDDSQLAQTWRLTSTPAGWSNSQPVNFTTVVAFYGHNFYNSPNESYTVKPGQTPNVKVELDYTTTASDYSLLLSDKL